MMETMVGSTRRRIFRFLSYRAAAVRALVDCACGFATEEGLEGDSDWGGGFGGDMGVDFERFEEPLGGKRGFLDGFIVGVRENEWVRACVRPRPLLPF